MNTHINTSTTNLALIPMDHMVHTASAGIFIHLHCMPIVCTSLKCLGEKVVVVLGHLLPHQLPKHQAKNQLSVTTAPKRTSKAYSPTQPEAAAMLPPLPAPKLSPAAAAKLMPKPPQCAHWTSNTALRLANFMG